MDIWNSGLITCILGRANALKWHHMKKEVKKMDIMSLTIAIFKPKFVKFGT